jgi:hypothetical protein
LADFFGAAALVAVFFGAAFFLATLSSAVESVRRFVVLRLLARTSQHRPRPS